MSDASDRPEVRLTVLMTPGSARRFFQALIAAFPGSRSLRWNPFSFRSYPDAAEVAERAYPTYLATVRPWHWSRWLPAPLARWVIRRQYAGLRRHWERHPGDVAVCWNGMDRGRFLFAESARRAGNPTLFAELSPLPGCIALDSRGINHLCSLPRSPGFYLAWARSAPPGQAARPELSIKARPPRKPRAAGPAPATTAPDGPFLFFPLQVPGDSQLRYFGDWLGSVEASLAAVVEASRRLPPGWHIRIKEHPTSRVSLAHLVPAGPGVRCFLDNDADTFDLVRRSRGVITVNSSVGIQAFFHDRPVIALGNAFWGFAPLVRKVVSAADLGEALAGAESLAYDPAARDAFLAYLARAYAFPGTLDTDALTDEQRQRVLYVLSRPHPAA